MVKPETFIYLHLVYHFEIPLTHQTWPVDRYKQRQYFSEIS